MRSAGWTWRGRWVWLVVVGVLVGGWVGRAWAQLQDAPWPMFHHDLQHIGRSPFVGPQTATLKWQFATGGHMDNSPAIGADGTIYVGSEDHNIYALNPDGTLKWQFATGGPVNNASPALSTDGTIYIGSEDHHFYALRSDGTLKWQFTTMMQVEDSAPAIGADGTIYVGSLDYHLYALNPDGTLKWQFATGDGVNSAPAIGADGTIYVGSRDHHLYALRRTAPSNGDLPPGTTCTQPPPSAPTARSMCRPVITTCMLSQPPPRDQAS